MVYVDRRNLGYKPYMWKWLNTRTKAGEAEALQMLIEKYAVPAIEWVCEGLDGHDLVKKPQQSVPHSSLNMATQLCKLLDATITDHPKMQDPQVDFWLSQCLDSKQQCGTVGEMTSHPTLCL